MVRRTGVSEGGTTAWIRNNKRNAARLNIFCRICIVCRTGRNGNRVWASGKRAWVITLDQKLATWRIECRNTATIYGAQVCCFARLLTACIILEWTVWSIRVLESECRLDCEDSIVCVGWILFTYVFIDSAWCYDSPIETGWETSFYIGIIGVRNFVHETIISFFVTKTRMCLES